MCEVLINAARETKDKLFFFSDLFHIHEQTIKEQESKAAVVSDDKKFNCDMMPSCVSPPACLCCCFAQTEAIKENIMHYAYDTYIYIYSFLFSQPTSGAAQFHESNHKPQQADRGAHCCSVS